MDKRREIIENAAKRNGIKKMELADLAGIPYSTYTAQANHIGTMTVCNLMSLYHSAGMTPGELLQVLGIDEQSEVEKLHKRINKAISELTKG